MLALVWLVYFSFGLTTGSIPPLVSPILEDLGMTSSQMGLVLGAWQLVYIGTASPLGTLVDRLGVRRSLALGTLVMLLSLVARGAANNFYTLFLAVGLFGFGGPIVSIGAPKLVSQWFQGRERGLAAGIYSTAPLAGSAFALATAGSLVLPLTGTWRGISLVYGAMVLAILAIWWAFARDHQALSGAEEGHSRREEARGWQVIRSLMAIRNVQLLLVMAVGSFLLNHGLNNWVPTLLEERGMTLRQAGIWAGVATAAGGCGLLSIPGLARRGYRVRVVIAILAVLTLSTLGLVLLDAAGLITALIITGFARSAMMPLLTLLLMETPGVGSRRMGAAAGLFFAAAEVGGFSGPVLMGALRDATGSLEAGLMVLPAVTALMVLVIAFVKESGAEVPRGA